MQPRPIALALALVVLAAIAAPIGAQSQKSEFDARAFYTAVPARGDISCPGGGEASPSNMPPWCGDARTKVRNRALAGAIVQCSDWRVCGSIEIVMNMNVNASFEGPIWGTYQISVPGHGTWEGTWQGKYGGPTLATYRLVAHGSGEFEGLELRASIVWQAGKGEALSGEIIETR